MICIVSAKVNLGYAQCAEKWDNARLSYEQGHLYGIPSQLSECLEHGFDKQEKIEAYRLLTITYLYIDDPYGAQNSFLNLLKLDPEYRIKTTDPIELEHLSKEYITTPIISWRARGGVNYSFLKTINKYSSGNDLLNTEEYTPSIGYSFVGSLDVHFNKVVSFGIDVDLSTNAYQYNNKLFDNDLGEQNAKDILEIKEVAYNASLPVFLKLTYPGIKYYPYVYGGYAPTYNIFTKADAQYTIVQNTGEVKNENRIGPQSLNISQIRTKFSHSLIIGAGLMRRSKYKYVFVDVKYRLGLTNLLNGDNQFAFIDEPVKYADVQTYTLTYYKIDSDFRESDFTLTIGYVWPQYKPRKKKTVTFGSMLGGLFKKKNKDE